MGALLSRFRWKRTPSPGADVNEEQKDGSSTDKDGVPVPSSPSQDTVLKSVGPVESRRWRKVSSAFFVLRVTSSCYLLSSLIHLSVSTSVVLCFLFLLVTIASNGSETTQESPTKKTGAPLAREEEAFAAQASPVKKDPKKEVKVESEAAKTKDIEQAPEPDVKELQRVNETKLEKEKSVDDSGVTTEKTVYTQIAESVTIQETKGPAVDPFASSQNTPSYVHSVKVTESSYASPSSPVSVSSDTTPEKTQSVPQISESVSEKVVSVPEKIEVTVKTEEVVEVATDVAESLNGSHVDQSQSEKVISPPLPSEEEQTQVEQETPTSEAEVLNEEQVAADGERPEVEGAVVKIQAGIRGYLTRKSLKESRKDGPMMQSPKGGASVQTSPKEDEAPLEEPPSKNDEVSLEEPSLKDATPLDELSSKEDQAILEESSSKHETPLEESSSKHEASLEEPSSKEDQAPLEEPLILNAEEQSATDDTVKEGEESDAAVKIQAMYRGYRTRKQLDELFSEPSDGEVAALDITAEQTESIVQETRKSPDRSPVTVTENFVPILKAQVTITPPSSPTIKREHNISSSVEVEPEDSKTSEIPEMSGDVDETVDVDDDEGDDQNKKQAATKIQAAFRGYKVRKVSKKESPGNVKEISEETKEDTVLGSDVNVEINLDSSQVPRGTPSPPLEPDDEDTLEENTADDADEIPNVQWQTSELYADDDTSPKHLQEESKTETVTEEPSVPVMDSSKTTQVSSAQVTLSPARVSPEESHGSAVSTTVEDQHGQSDN